MPRGPAVFGVKWEQVTENGYKVQVVRDPEIEDMLKSDLDIKRGIYQVILYDGDDVLELYHEFNLNDATARAKSLAEAATERETPAKASRKNLEDYL